MAGGVNGRIFHPVMPLVVKVLKHRVDLAVSQLVHVVESHVLVLIFSLQHAMLVHVVQVS